MSNDEATTPALPGLQVRLDSTGSRYEGRIDDQQVGVVDFRLRDGVVLITHTGTEPQWRGRGIAAALTRYALDDLRHSGRRIQAICPYTAHFIAEHPDYRDLLVDDATGKHSDPQ